MRKPPGRSPLLSRFYKKDLLPFAAHDRPRHAWARLLRPRRWSRNTWIVCFVLFSFLYYFKLGGRLATRYIARGLGWDDILPPLFEEYHAYELALPQHDPTLPFPEGQDGKYFWIPNHVWGSGWGNAMQEVLLNAHLAYVSGYSYVFDNYTWHHKELYSWTGREFIPSKIPLNAFINGPAAGGPFPRGIDAPRAVMPEYYRQVCPKPTILRSEDVVGRMSNTAQEVLDKWSTKLRSIDARCVEIHKKSWQIWSIWVLGSEKILDIWPSLKNSPVITEFRWSPLVERAVAANLHLLTSSDASTATAVWTPLRASAGAYLPIPGLLVLHVRRGDFAKHCTHLAKWAAGWNGFNLFPELIDRFVPPPGGGQGKTTRANLDAYRQRCFPSVAQIVQKVEEVRGTPSGQGLRNVYVMTNGEPEWVEELKGALFATGHWEKVSTSRDLMLDREQQYVGQGVDMLIGQRAQVLIGNGFSSFTSNIVMLRMAQDPPPDSNRFW